MDFGGSAMSCGSRRQPSASRRWVLLAADGFRRLSQEFPEAADEFGRAAGGLLDDGYESWKPAMSFGGVLNSKASLRYVTPRLLDVARARISFLRDPKRFA